MSLTFAELWANHPYPDTPCDEDEFENQCAIRMGVALEESGVDTSTFDLMYPKRRCWMGHKPGHILAAQELANWLENKADVFGIPKKRKGVTSADYKNKRGIVFIRDGWGTMDHIDLWDGSNMKGGSPSYFAKGKEVWFWSF